MKKIITLLFIISLLPALKSNADNKVLIENVKKELSKANSSKDSVRLLYDLWDLSLRKDQLAIGNQLFDIASRANIPEVQYDILRQMANITRNDTILKDLEAKAKALPESPGQKETVAFIRIKKSTVRARYFPEERRQQKIAKIIQINNFDKLDKYGKIERLFTICEYLSNYADGDLLIKYMENLEQLMEAANLKSYALENLFYTESANIYSYTGKGDKAIEADRKLLKIMEQLEKEYKSKGRRYRNYDVNRYLVLRRMLGNYKHLNKKEANNIYNQILEIVERNGDAKKNFESHKRTKAFHAMVNGKYAEAIPYLKDNLSKETNMPLPTRKQLTEILIEAAKKTGDQATLAEAEGIYKPIKQEYDSLHTKSKYNELKVRYQINILKSNIDRMKLENKDMEITSTRRIMTFVIIGWVAFGIILILMLILWTRYKRNTIHLEKFVKSLAIERARYNKENLNLQKTNKTLPTAKIEKRQKQTVDGMLNYVLNDLLFIASVGQEEANQFSEDVDVTAFLNERLETMSAHVTKNLKFEVKYPDPNFTLFVDKECLTLLIEHIQHMAVRLTPTGGTVGIGCEKNGDGTKAEFTIWHSGNTLPDSRMDVIFDNFFTFDNLTEEKGSALEMCRLIHLLIETTMQIEKTENLVTLTFSIPINE